MALPLLFGVAAAGLMSWLVPRPSGGWLVPLWWLGALGASALAVGVAVRQLERLMPLVALLRLSLAFPDHTPSRARLALRAGSLRRLEDSQAEVRANEDEEDVNRAAGTVLVLATALTTHDRRTRGHSERVRALSELIAEELHLSSEDHDRLRWASLLHDCGKVTVDPMILNKSGPLNEEEWAIMRRHPEEGALIAVPLQGWLGEWSLAIGQHHERWDGTGYPRGLAGEEISLAARIVAVADAFDVMTSARAYHAPMSTAAARIELTTMAGTQFDPAVVRAFLLVSTGRLHRALGPLSWLAQVPLAGGGVASAVGGSVRAARRAQGVVSTAAVAAAVTVGVLGAGPATRPARVAPNFAASAAPPVILAKPAAQPVALTPPPAPPAPVATGASVPRASAGKPASPAPLAPAVVPPRPSPPSASPPPGSSVIGPQPAAPLVQAEVRVPQAQLSASVAAVPGVCAKVVSPAVAASC